MNFLNLAWAAASSYLPQPRSIWGWVVTGLDAVRRGFLSIISSKSMLAALAVTALAAYWGGFIVGARHAREEGPQFSLMGPLPTAQSAASPPAPAPNDEVARWRAETETQLAEVRRLTAELATTKDALAGAQEALRRRPAQKATPAKASPPAPVWNPFSKE